MSADDYGLTDGVSRAILRAHHDGIVTSTSVITTAPAFATTVGWLDDAPDLGVGLHLAAVGADPPLLTAQEIPTLVDRQGHLARGWRQLLPRLATGRIDPADLDREFSAQHQRLVHHGITPSHLDVHENLHLWPSVATLVTELAGRWSIGAVRVPSAIGATPLAAGVRRLGRRLGERLDAAGRVHAEDVSGLDQSGRMDAAAVEQLLTALGKRQDTGPVEITLHPGAEGDPDEARYPWPGRSRATELEAAVDPIVCGRIDEAGLVLASYRSLSVASSSLATTPGT